VQHAVAFSIFEPYELALVGEPGEADTQTLINTLYAAYLPYTRCSPVAPRTTKEGAGLIPLLADHPTHDGRVTAYVSVKATSARTRRPTRRGWRGSSASRRDRKIGGRSSILPDARTPEDGVTREGDLLGTDLGPPGAESRKRKTRRKSAAQG
jgi:hypothetical protein